MMSMVLESITAGMAKITMNAVVTSDHTNMGMRLSDIPGERIFLVQLADYLGDLKDITETADHRRAFPNESAHRDVIGTLVRKIHRAGYRGDYVFEVFNDEYLHLAPESIVSRARRAAQWLVGETAQS